MYKVSNGLSSPPSRPLIKTVFHGTESISSLGPVIWDILPVTFKESEAVA